MNCDSDGRCFHCGTPGATNGCTTCMSSRTFCGYGSLMCCGCGLTFKHDCPSVRLVGSVTWPTAAEDAGQPKGTK